MDDLSKKEIKRLDKLINKHHVVLFMKGTKKYPECGFSEKIVKILNKTGVPYKTFDVMENDEVRENLKIYSSWPTYPQLYVNGEMIGGLDVVQELEKNGALMTHLKPPANFGVVKESEEGPVTDLNQPKDPDQNITPWILGADFDDPKPTEPTGEYLTNKDNLDPPF